MSKDLKNERQVRFADLVQRAKVIGFSPADISRAINLSKPSISKILKGEQSPRLITIMALEGKVIELESARQRGEEIVRKAETEEDLLKKIEFLRETDPPAYQSVRSIVQALHERAANSSGADDAARAAVIGRQAGVVPPTKGSSRSPRVVSPTDGKPAKASTAGRHSGAKPPPPKQAPK